jgi:hypothetical protein
MPIIEDLSERVHELERAVTKLCRRAGHDEWEGAYPPCGRHNKLREDADERCTTCREFRCCEAIEAAHP